MHSNANTSQTYLLEVMARYTAGVGRHALILP